MCRCQDLSRQLPFTILPRPDEMGLLQTSPPSLPPSLVAPARFSSLADWEKVFFWGVSPVCQKSPPGGIAQSEIPRELERSNTELQTQIQTAFWEEVCQDVRRLIRRPAGVKGQGQSHPLTTIIWSFTNAGRSGRHRHAML